MKEYHNPNLGPKGASYLATGVVKSGLRQMGFRGVNVGLG